MTDASHLRDATAAYSRGDYQTAFSLFLPLAAQGDVAAQNNVGAMYEKGLGVPQDYAEAMKWYRKSVDQGDAHAQYNLGVMYDNGHGVPQDDAEAVKWYSKAAEQGLFASQHNLGVMYASGRGVPKNDAVAVKWFRRAAEQGFAFAQNNLGAMYGNGRGVPKDSAEAMKWYQKAAEQGDAAAQRNLVMAQLEKMKLTNDERQMIAEAEVKGEDFTPEHLDVLRSLNFGNPEFGRPSKEVLRRVRMTSEEILQEAMWEITGEAQYRPLSARIGKLFGIAVAVVVWFVLPVVGIVFLSRWLLS